MSPLQRIAISNNRIELFRCPHRFRMIVLERFKEKKGFPALRGIWAHTFLERYVRHLIDTKQTQDLEQAEILFNQLWISDPLPPESKQELFDITVGYVRLVKFDVKKVVGPEFAFNLDWDLNQLDDTFHTSVWFRAKLDLLSFQNGDTAIVDDYKTGWRMIPQGELKEEPQARTYAWLVFFTFEEIQKVIVRFRYPRLKTSTEVTFDRSDIAHMEQTIREVSDQIEYRRTLTDRPEKVWPAIPSDVCGYCQVPCPILQDLSETDQVITNPAQALKIAKEYIALDRGYEKRKELLKEWVENNGPIDVSGVSIGYVVKEQNSYDAKTIVDTLAGDEYDVEDLYNLSSKAVESFIKKNPRTAPLFEAYNEKKAQTEFRITDPSKVIKEVDKQPKSKKKKKGDAENAEAQQSLAVS